MWEQMINEKINDSVIDNGNNLWFPYRGAVEGYTPAAACRFVNNVLMTAWMTIHT